jgi:hypothetical protein
MSRDHEYTVDTARHAAEQGQLDDWVARFLASPGSDNALLGENLTQHRRWWLGPVLVPSNRLHRLAGPPDAPVLCPVDDDYWRDDVQDLADRIEGDDEFELPPVVVTYEDGKLMLEDGNHRVEGARRADLHEVWAVIAFDDPAERDNFTVPAPAPATADSDG